MAEETKNKVIERRDGYLRVELTQGYNTLVDDTPQMWDMLSKHRFHSRKCKSSPIVYACTTEKAGRNKRRNVYLHHLVRCKTKGMDVDHANGISLDNRSANLRTVSRRINMLNKPGVLSSRNTSGICGIQRRKKNLWVACWYDENRMQHIKSFCGHRWGGSDRAKELAVAHLAKMHASLPSYVAARHLQTEKKE